MSNHVVGSVKPENSYNLFGVSVSYTGIEIPWILRELMTLTIFPSLVEPLWYNDRRAL